MARITIKEPISDEAEPLPEETPPPQPAAVQEQLPPETAQPAEPAVMETRTAAVPSVRNPKRFSSTVIIAAVAVLVVSILLVVLLSDRNSLKKEVGTLRNVGQVKSASDTLEAEQLKAEIGEFLELPADETPTLATVADASKVKGQSFFINAQNGDKVLLFSKAGKAILYRPSTKKVIEVAPINLNNSQQPGSTTSPAPVTPPAGTTNRR